jgi:transcriptional regulator with XRE-family HTH domain
MRSRGAFAKVLNVPVETLRAWEIGRRNPSGAALRLLQIAERALDVLAFYARPQSIKNRGAAHRRKLATSRISRGFP